MIVINVATPEARNAPKINKQKILYQKKVSRWMYNEAPKQTNLQTKKVGD